MSTDTKTDDLEEPLSDCVEPGCDVPATHLAPVTDSQYVPRTVAYRLTCEQHAKEDAWDLREVDLRGYDRKGLDDDAWPRELQRVCALGSVLNWYIKPPREDWTLSTVVRDLETREIKAEGTLHPTTGIFALVRIKPDDGDTEDLNEQFARDRTEIPEWVEWQHLDPPLEHLANGSRCTDCGEEKRGNRGMPGRVSTQWKNLRHRADCPHASEIDEEIWAEKQLAEEIYERPSPRIMALDCIWDELGELQELWGSDHHGYLTDALDDRGGRFEPVLEERLTPRYPECQECGAVDWRRDPEGDWIDCCNECHTAPEYETGVREQYRTQRHRLWGFRGHGERGRES